MSQKAIEAKTQSPESRNPGPEYRRLGVFIGKWNMEGQQHEGMIGPAAKLTASETFEWLTGGRFVVHRFEGRVGDAEAACVEIIGYDAAKQNYFLHTFYNDGRTNEWQATESDGVWTLTGDWQMGDQPMKVRCTVKFGDEGKEMTGNWEHSSDGSAWETFWDVKSRKE